MHSGNEADAKLECMDQAILNIEKAVLGPSTPEICPLQYSLKELKQFKCATNQRDVTDNIKQK
jgi:hypothetical protein